MSAPVSTGLGQDWPTYRIDGLILADDLGYVDDQGRHWWLTGEAGWSAGPARRPQRDDRVQGDGTFRGPSHAGGKEVTLRGTVALAAESQREPTLLELAGFCGDGGRLYELRRTAGPYDLVRYVEVDGEPDIDDSNRWMIDFQFALYAPDPRKHNWAWQQPICHPPAPTPGGLAFPLNFGGAGLDFGSPRADSTVAQVGNYGTAPARPLLRLEGPLSAPAVLHRESGRALRYLDDLDEGEVLLINCDDVAQGGVAAHAVRSSARGNVASLLVREGRDWPTVDPQGAASFQLRATGSPAASLRIGLRSAWW